MLFRILWLLPFLPTVSFSEPRKKHSSSKPVGSSQEVRGESVGAVTVIPAALTLVPSTFVMYGTGVRADFYQDDRDVLGVMAIFNHSEYNEMKTHVNMLDFQFRRHFRNSFYLTAGAGLRYFDREGLEGNVIFGTHDRNKSYHFSTMQPSVSAGLGNHWSWESFSIGALWFGVTIPSPGLGITDKTDSDSTISPEERNDASREFRGDSTEFQWNFVQFSLGMTF